MRSFFAFTTITSLLVACSGSGIFVGSDPNDGGNTSDGGGRDGSVLPDGASGSCATDADCGSSGICGFPTADACGAQGVCFPKPQSGCNAIAPGCACDGSRINLACNGLPNGYAPKPLLHAGECTASDDAGTGACTKDADCNGGLCGFPQADGCNAKGTCFPQSGPVCGAYSAGCACDGSEINIACTGLPQGYYSKPLRATGKCQISTGCTKASDCGAGMKCGFPTADGCAAKGRCFPLAPTCATFSPGCACDGTIINTICTGMPDGYTEKPLSNSGLCDGQVQ